jgi:hypothetical protein
MIQALRAGSEASGGVRIPRLLIAAGSRHQVVVYDVRGLGPWAVPTRRVEGQARRVVYHHTASAAPDVRSLKTQLARLELERNGAPWGLPYNFIVEAFRPWRVWYLNDVDMAWPHTYGGNDACAIAGWGNYEEEPASLSMARRMGFLADALATMWDIYVPEHLHKQFTPTACPGRHLSAILEVDRHIGAPD